MTADVKQFRPKSSANKVLLVDDDPIQLRTREAILRNAGLDVAIATRAAAALSILKECTPYSFGAVITDHMMPDLSGVEFVRRLRENDSVIPIVVLSGLPDAADEYEGLNVVFRQKPCPPRELIDVVKRFLDRAA